MRIDKLFIQSFGKWSKFNIDFHPGINVLYGRNEAGKSTMQNFIKAMLYGPRSFSNNRSEWQFLKKAVPWSENALGGSLEYSLHNGEAFRVERDFIKSTVKIFDSYLNEINESFESTKEYGPLFQQNHIGLSMREFISTAFIEQMGIKVGSTEKKELFERVSNITTSGSENVSVSRAVSFLQDLLKQNVGNERTKNRPLDKINMKIEELTLKKKQLEDILKRYTEIDKEYHENVGKMTALKDLETSYASINTVITSKRKRDDLHRELQRARYVYSSLNIVTEEKEDLESKLNNTSLNEENEDFDIGIEYYKYTEVLASLERLNDRSQKKNVELLDLEKQLEPLKIFRTIDEGKHNEIRSKILKLESMSDLEPISKEVSNRISFYKRSTFWIVVILWIFILPFVWDKYYIGFSMLTGLALSVLVALNFSYWKNPSKNIDSKNQENHNTMTKMRKELVDWINIQGMTGISEYIEKHRLYASLCVDFENTVHDLDEIESQIDQMEKSKNDSFDKIHNMLNHAGIELGEQGILTDTMIDNYKKIQKEKLEETARYKECGEKIAGYEREIERFKLELSQIFNTNELDITSCEFTLMKMEATLENLETELDKALMDLKSDDEEIRNLLISGNVEALEVENNSRLEKTRSDLKEVELKIREIEVLKSDYNNVKTNYESLMVDMETENEKKRELDRIGSSIKLASDILIEAGEELKKSYVPKLNDKMGYYLEKLTGAQYKGLSMDMSMDLKTFDPVAGNVVSVDLLSGGTVHQVYFAMRLALVEGLSDGKEPIPLILDEVFANFDDRRVEYALEVLNELSNTNQIILFTCKEREVELVDKMCTNANVVNL